MKDITLAYADVRHEVIPCGHCGRPLMAGDSAVEVIDEHGPVACSRYCGAIITERLTRHTLAMPRETARNLVADGSIDTYPGGVRIDGRIYWPLQWPDGSIALTPESQGDAECAYCDGWVDGAFGCTDGHGHLFCCDECRDHHTLETA